MQSCSFSECARFSLLRYAGDLQHHFAQMGIRQETMHLPTEGARLTNLKGADDGVLGSRGNLDGGLGLRTEAGIYPSAVSQPDDLHHLVRRVS